VAAPDPTRDRARLAWVDVARGLGIVLVLLGHSPALRGAPKTLIYAFHMPLFFFLSGFLATPASFAVPFASYVASQARRLLVPYFAFSALSYPIWLLALAGGRPHESIDPLRPLLGTLYGNGTDGWLDHNVALWFFVCLFGTRLLFFWIARLGSPRAIALALAGLALVGIADVRFDPLRLPWSLNVTPVAAVFFGAGFLVRAAPRGLADPARLPGWLALPAAAALAALSACNGRTDMNGESYGNAALFFAAAGAGIVMTLALARALAGSAPLAHVGRNTAAIFPAHIPFFTLLSGVAVGVLGWSPSFNDRSMAIGVGYTLLALAALTPLGDWLRAHAPWLIGEARDRAARA